MKTDLYTKVILTVIAVCLVYFVVNQLQIFPTAKASATNLSDKNYVSVPVKPDGSIDVNVVKMNETVDVNIEEVGGYDTYGKLPVEVKNTVGVDNSGQFDVYCENCK